MNSKIRQILDQITTLEDELNTLLDAQQERLRYQLEDKRVTFEHAVREAHQRVKVGVFKWFRGIRPLNLVTAPVIYGMIVPLAFFDLCLTIYQATCFPIYRITKAKRGDYIVFDHQHLAYLNIIEKVDCLYCSYAVGLLAYATEITGRTEQYFCPIKHARKVAAAHARYRHFLPYGEADGFHEKLEEFRTALEPKQNDDKAK
ncbi:MAG TPA: hypothetical protein VFK88_09025 [Gallionella sp.]|nr:hypothetical protein [Gallionella sp.]